MKRVWLVGLDGTCWAGGTVDYLPHWFETKADALKARDRYVSENLVDCPTFVKRFDAFVPQSSTDGGSDG